MLRAATLDLHAAVDARFSESFTGNAAAYAGFLSALAAGLMPLERALERAGIDRVLPDWPDRRRASLLLEDLDALGVPPTTEAEAPAVEGEARQLGVVYVLEGSRLGGKLLLRRAQAHADPRVRAATRYLSHGIGRDFWPSFVARLEASRDVDHAPDEAVAGARAAFTLFSDRRTHG